MHYEKSCRLILHIYAHNLLSLCNIIIQKTQTKTKTTWEISMQEASTLPIHISPNFFLISNAEVN